MAVAGLATAGFFWLEGSIWLFLLLILAPDLSMLGYLGGEKLGSRVYNVFHNYVGPLALIAVGIWQSVPLATLLGLVWAAHIGADRALGYGLKHPTGFKDTHLGRIGGENDRTRRSTTQPNPVPAPGKRS